ncbi:MAG TPA: FecR domain-containing protein, partial [Actinomycetota bacterium]|nr:FecR domain-containing protein [Actinomycetota bacterium]
MHIEDERLYPLLERYLAGETSAGDAEIVREWLAEDAAHPQLLADLRLIKHVTSDTPPPTSVDAAWMQAVKTLGLRRKPRVSRRSLMVALAAAAVLIAVIGGGRVLRRAPQWKEYATAAAQRMVIRLQDGTQVTIAPKSRVRYTADFGRAHRDLYLDGEAYFQVAPDSQRPLRVHTSGSVTEDLGTAFVVNAYADQIATEVVVTEGRVSLSRGETTSSVVLGLRDLGRLDASGRATVRRGVDVDRYLAWTKGVLAFDGEPLRDVVLT